VEEEIFKKSGKRLGIKILLEPRNTVVKEETAAEEIVVEEEEASPQPLEMSMSTEISRPQKTASPRAWKRSRTNSPGR